MERALGSHQYFNDAGQLVASLTEHVKTCNGSLPLLKRGAFLATLERAVVFKRVASTRMDAGLTTARSSSLMDVRFVENRPSLS